MAHSFVVKIATFHHFNSFIADVLECKAHLNVKFTCVSW